MTSLTLTLAAAAALLAGPHAQLFVTQVESAWQLAPSVQSPLGGNFRVELSVETLGPGGRSQTRQGNAITLAPNQPVFLGNVRIGYGSACRVKLTLFQAGVVVAEDLFLCPAP